MFRHGLGATHRLLVAAAASSSSSKNVERAANDDADDGCTAKVRVGPSSALESSSSLKSGMTATTMTAMVVSNKRLTGVVTKRFPSFSIVRDDRGLEYYFRPTTSTSTAAASQQQQQQSSPEVVSSTTQSGVFEVGARVEFTAAERPDQPEDRNLIALDVTPESVTSKTKRMDVVRHVLRSMEDPRWASILQDESTPLLNAAEGHGSGGGGSAAGAVPHGYDTRFVVRNADLTMPKERGIYTPQTTHPLEPYRRATLDYDPFGF